MLRSRSPRSQTLGRGLREALMLLIGRTLWFEHGGVFLWVGALLRFRRPDRSANQGPPAYSCRLAGFFFLTFEPFDRPRQQI